MPLLSRALLEPRKSPVQARSTASVDAILEATIQVLLQFGKERLTTTRVAARAGVSVGTLYQYFPNKTSLLQAVLKRHLNQVTDAIETVCQEQHGQPLKKMATALITAFLKAKMLDPKTSVALYSVSADVDGLKIAQQTRIRSDKAIMQMLETAPEKLTTDPRLVNFMLQSMMVGVSRRMLESAPPEKVDTIARELILTAHAYLNVCSARDAKTPV